MFESILLSEKLSIPFTWLHWVCLIIGTLSFFFIKALQKYKEQKDKGIPFFWGDYTVSPETLIPLILTLFCGFFAMLLAIEKLPTRPIYSAVSTGLACMAGYAAMRSTILAFFSKK